MTIYRKLWTWGWGATTGLAAVIGVLLGGVEIPLLAAVLATWVTVGTGLVRQRDQHPQLRHSGGTRDAVVRGLKVGVVVGAVVASVGLIGALVIPLALVAALTSPHFNAVLDPPSRHRMKGDHDRTQSVAPQIQITATALRAAVETLDDVALCRAWRCSYAALDRMQKPHARLEICNLRQAYLDEIERRHPAGFRAWLTAGARPASDPTRFLQTGHRHRGDAMS